MEILSIGQVARRAGVGVETVRFYEREGLLEEPPRRASGYRQYSEQVVKRIHFIKRAQKLGFSLKEITELLLLRVDGQTSCEEVKGRTLVGGGDGTLSGPRMRGTVRWSNYETTGEDQVCTLQVPGVIQTYDGALIQFEGRELAMPLSDESKQWRVAGVLRFKTDDSRYV